MNVSPLKLALLASVALGSASAAPIQWTVGSGGNGHYYEFVSTAVNWSTARTGALGSSYLGLNGYLATITSAQEQSFLWSNFKSLAWVGGSDEWDPSSESDQQIWKWMDGPEAGQIFWNNGPTLAYAFWSGGEPNNCCGGEDYLQYAWNLSTGAWNDHGGPGNPSQVNGYLIEYSQWGNVPEPATTAALLGLALGSLALARRRA